jgi:hypothetical protein
MAARKNKTTATFSFTATETVSLPTDDSPVLAIRSRDWRRVKTTVEQLSTEVNGWEIAFTVSLTVFFAFLLPVLTTPGPIEGLKLLYTCLTLFSFGSSLSSLFAMMAARKRRNTDRSDLLDLIEDIESMYTLNRQDDTAIQPQPARINDDISLTNDDMYEEAKQVAFELGKVSASLLQRKLRIGYARAARIVDQMEKDGIASESDGARPRSILLNPNDVNLNKS